MIFNLLLSWDLLLLSIHLLVAHPGSDSADMLRSSPDLSEEAGAVNPDELSSVWDISSLLQGAAALGYSPQLSTQGLKVKGPLPKEAVKEVLLEKPGYLSSLSRLLSIKRPYRRRANRADCFWKYCV